MISKKQQMRLRGLFTHIKPTISIGKNGVTTNLIQEVLKQFKTNEAIKIRVLKSALQHETFKAIRSSLIERIPIDWIEIRGHNILLYKANEEH